MNSMTTEDNISISERKSQKSYNILLNTEKTQANVSPKPCSDSTIKRQKLKTRNLWQFAHKNNNDPYVIEPYKSNLKHIDNRGKSRLLNNTLALPICINWAGIRLERPEDINEKIIKCVNCIVYDEEDDQKCQFYQNFMGGLGKYSEKWLATFLFVKTKFQFQVTRVIFKDYIIRDLQICSHEPFGLAKTVLQGQRFLNFYMQSPRGRAT